MNNVTLNRCKICNSPSQKKIERDILLRVPFKEIQEKYDLSYPTIRKHKDKHMSIKLAIEMRDRLSPLDVKRTEIEKDIPNVNNMLACISFIHNGALSIYSKSIDAGNDQVALQALKADMDCLSLALKGKELLLQYESQGGWEKALPKILKAIDKFPEVKLAVSDALNQ